jgi:cytoskeletal protein RodZ
MKEMPTVAEQLRAAREAKKLTIPQVAELTKIRTDHLRALEDGNFNAFSAPIYIRGSVKNYATTLKLDVPQIMAALNAELSHTEKFAEPPPLMEESHSPLDYLILLLSKINAKVAMIGAVILAVILLIALASTFIKSQHSNNPVANLPPAVYQSTNSDATLPVPHR